MGYSDRRDPIGAEAIARFRVDRRDWPDRYVLAIAQFAHGTRGQRFEEVFPDGATSHRLVARAAWTRVLEASGPPR